MDWRDAKSEGDLKKLGGYETVKEEINYELSPLLRIKSRSWKELLDYVQALQAISQHMLREELEELELLRVKANQQKTPTYFKTYADEYIFYLLELHGTFRLKKLGVTKSMYVDNARARKWYLTVAQIIHPDVCLHVEANKAFETLNELYEEMVARILKINESTDV